MPRAPGKVTTVTNGDFRILLVSALTLTTVALIWGFVTYSIQPDLADAGIDYAETFDPYETDFLIDDPTDSPLSASQDSIQLPADEANTPSPEADE